MPYGNTSLILLRITRQELNGNISRNPQTSQNTTTPRSSLQIERRASPRHVTHVTYPAPAGAWWAPWPWPGPPADTQRSSGSPGCRLYPQKILLPHPAVSAPAPSRARCGSSRLQCRRSFPAQSNLRPLKRICASHLHLKQIKANRIYTEFQSRGTFRYLLFFTTQLFLHCNTSVLGGLFKHLKAESPRQSTRQLMQVFTAHPQLPTCLYQHGKGKYNRNNSKIK